jgi:hypothetical protein
MDPTPHNSTDQDLKDSITYLASLVTESKAIDRELDTLRHITVSKQVYAPLSEDERAQLQQVVAALKNYLINNDPLREFNEESLNARLRDYLQKNRTTGTWVGGLNFQTAVLLSILGAAPTAILLGEGSIWNRVLLAIPFFLLLTTLCSSWFYLTSMRNFKPELRSVFIYFCLGSIGVGLQFLHFVAIQLLNQEQSPVYRYGGVTMISALSLFTIYLGMRRYATLLNLKNRFISLALAGPIFAFVMSMGFAVAYLLPAPHTGYLGFSLGSLFFLSSAAFMGASIARTIMHSVTSAYRQSMQRLYIFCMGAFVAPLAFAGFIIVRGELYGAALSAALGICAMPPLLLLLHSGYTFKRETSR